jgi:uncharacterized damage-inducible protein DinB
MNRAGEESGPGREIERLVELHGCALRGPSWHGPALLEVLEGVDAAAASRRPIGSAHTIWEIVRHIETWDRVVLRRIQGTPFQPTDEEDWPPVAASDEVSWKRDVASMTETHDELNRAIRTLSPASLDQPVAPGKRALFHMVHGAVAHELYHAGQIAILRKG